MRQLGRRFLYAGIIVVTTMLFLILFDSIGLFDLIIKADDAGWSENNNGELPGDETSDKFTIVEIMPYKGMGEIGYFVGGQEPVDDELLDSTGMYGIIGIVGNAVSIYSSHVEKPLPASGVVEAGWVKAKDYEVQSGYFELVDKKYKGTRYKYADATTYEFIPNKGGDLKAVLTGGSLENVYNINSTSIVNRRNLNAHFVLGNSGIPTVPGSAAYEPYSVTKNSTHTGDYDYNCQNGTFRLNIGHGAYDVLFINSTGTTPSYYMAADYEIVSDKSGDYSWNVSYIPITDGDYKAVNGKSFSYNPDNGTYRWVQSEEEALKKPYNYYHDGNKIWVQGAKVLVEYQFTRKYTIVNNEWLKRYTLGISPEHVNDYLVEVITITPNELNKEENQHYIDEADMFYINSSIHNSEYINLYEDYSYEGRVPSQYSLNFANNDLTWDNVEKIFKRAAGIEGTNKAAMIVDNGYFRNAVQGSGDYNEYKKSVEVSYSWNDKSATINNIAKLYIMIYQRDMMDFYNAFMNPATSTHLITKQASTDNTTGYTGSFVRPDSSASRSSIEATYWNGNTFVPYGLDEDGTMTRYDREEWDEYIPNFNITQQTTDLISNVLVLNGQDIFTRGKFFSVLDQMPSSGVNEAVLHMSSLNPEDGIIPSYQITLANYINVITNNGQGYPNGGTGGTDTGEDGTGGSNLRSYTTVLNLQPTADFTTSENEIRKLMEGYTLKIVNMTSSEFNGSLTDINTHYDMIYMGSGVGRFNSVLGVTTFNDLRFLRSVYNYGDEIDTSFSYEKRYVGNDITSQKKKELEDFLKAGYPIVMEGSLYELSDLVTLYAPNMNTFIRQAKIKYSSINFLNLNDYKSYSNIIKQLFQIRLKHALNIIRPMIKILEPELLEGAKDNYIRIDPVTKQLNIEFALIPTGILPSSYSYIAHLYLDYNGDGIFASSEELDIAPRSEGVSPVGIKESKFRSYLYDYQMGNKNGVYQWQVKVIRLDDNNNETQIRSEITGYASITNKENIYVLQIKDNDSDYNLGGDNAKINDSSSLFWKYASNQSVDNQEFNKMTDYNIVFDTMSVADFQSKYQAQPNALSKYHLLIMDNPKTQLPSALATYVKEEIKNHQLGVIFTKGTILEDTQSQFLESSNYLFVESSTFDFTYNYLNFKALDWQYYIYEELYGNGSLKQAATYNTTALTQANEGAIEEYPYNISASIPIATNTYSMNTTIDLNTSTTGQIPLIGWFCLSDAKSPKVDPGVSNANRYKGLYSSSPNDVKNNYYLFNRGNIFYSGIALKNADIQHNDMEIQLFVNTIISAYHRCGRKVTIPPVIQIKYPNPVVMDGKQTIVIKPQDISDGNFTLFFEIKESSSNMDLDILLKGLIPSGKKIETIYEASPTNVVSNVPISIAGSLKTIENGRYAVKIPITDLTVTQVLTIWAKNKEEVFASTDVTLLYSQKPTVKVIAPDLFSNAKDEQFVYVDLDYQPEDEAESYLETAQKLILKVEITNSSTEVFMDFLSTQDGVLSSIVEPYHIKVFPIVNEVRKDEIDIATEKVSNGIYEIELPMSLMEGKSSRDLTISATDNFNKKGSTSIILLKRNLFPYD